MKFGKPPWQDKTPAEPIPRQEAPPMESTKEEALNGWTPEALAKYHREAAADSDRAIMDSMNKKLHGPRTQPDTGDSPFDW